MARGTECYCGNSISGDAVSVPAQECDGKCPGNIIERRGQKERMIIYGTVSNTPL